jgi:hypothetical protein
MTSTLLDLCSGVTDRSIVPALENGDRLTRDEFERRWNAMPGLKHAELIEGVVFMPSPVRFDRHGHAHSSLQGWAYVYEAGTPGVQSGDNTSVRLDLDNILQPDTLLRIVTACGGQSIVDAGGYLTGGPELVGEIAASNTSIDLHDKLHVYRKHGVKEYIVWRVLDMAIDWFILRGSQYERLPFGTDGIYRSEVFSGLWLDAAAMINGNSQRVLEVLQHGMATKEHTELVTRLGYQAAE